MSLTNFYKERERVSWCSKIFLFDTAYVSWLNFLVCFANDVVDSIIYINFKVLTFLVVSFGAQVCYPILSQNTVLYFFFFKCYRPLLNDFQGKGTPNQDLACFVHYCKIINTVLKSDTCILKKIVRETQKWLWNFSMPHGSWDIDQYVQNIVLINKSRTAWHTEILMPFSSFSDNLLQDAYIIFQ